MRLRVLLRLLGLALLIGLLPQPAAAFCRATTIESAVDSCFVCETAGYPLAWSEPSVEYTLNERGFPNFSEAELREIFEQAFNKWTSVQCSGRLVDLDVQAAPGTTSLGVRDRRVQPTINVLGYLSDAEWIDANYDPHAFAQTGVRYYPDSGVIAGADIWFNGGIGDFDVCPDRGCTSEFDNRVDMPNVVTHEVGHFFGLAHSHVEGATMGCDALPGDTDKRSLEFDDRAGMCAIYPPEVAFRGAYLRGEWTKPKVKDSCSVSAPGAGSLGWISLSVGFGLALALLHRRRAA
jgi:hypothetical protein